jgi:sulfofructose kinase
MPPEFDVVCVGAANLDTIATVERAPGDDERTTSEPFLTAGGGPASTAAVALARLGVRVAVCAVVGDDREGELVLEYLRMEGVDTRWVRVDRAVSTARAIIIASRATGGRSIITTVAPPPSADDIPVGVGHWLHVDQTGYSPTRAAMHSGARERLSIDAGNPISGMSLDGVDLYAPTLGALLNRYQSRDVEDAFAAARAEGARAVVATSGGEGTYVWTAGGVRHIPAFAVDVVSTLGAGDVFHGALLAGLVGGAEIEKAARAANAAAAMSCRELDGRSGIPTRRELDVFVSGNSAGTREAREQ